jgi:hypothetical protein
MNTDKHAWNASQGILANSTFSLFYLSPSDEERVRTMGLSSLTLAWDLAGRLVFSIPNPCSSVFIRGFFSYLP